MKKIGVFDSGLGGLTAVRALRRLLPHEDIVYFGDTGRVPYGNRSRETIRRYTAQDIAFLRSFDVKLMIAACGTVSSVASDLGEALDIPFTGVVLPAAQAAVEATRTGRIGAIGTAATIRSGAYRRYIKEMMPDALVFEKYCPLFVPLVENGFIGEDDMVVSLVVERYLEELKQKDIDTLILGCTHYPIIAPVIGRYMGDNVQLIDSGAATAQRAKTLLIENDLLADDSHEGTQSFYVSDRTEDFAATARILLGEDIAGNVSMVDIEQY